MLEKNKSWILYKSVNGECIFLLLVLIAEFLQHSYAFIKGPIHLSLKVVVVHDGANVMELSTDVIFDFLMSLSVFLWQAFTA